MTVAVDIVVADVVVVVEVEGTDKVVALSGTNMSLILAEGEERWERRSLVDSIVVVVGIEVGGGSWTESYGRVRSQV